MRKVYPVSDLIHLLPHRPPMVWIDRVLEVRGAYESIAGSCAIKVNPDGLYLTSQASLRASSVIEFTAQAYAYLKAAYQLAHSMHQPPRETYLTGVRSSHADFTDMGSLEDRELRVEISVLRQIKQITFVRGEIYEIDGDKCLAQADIQVYVD